jgi:flagellar motor switch protein FliM
MAQILSQDEIDALLTTVSAGEETEEKAEGLVESKSIVAYDFKHPNRVSKDQIRTLENVHDNFGGHLGSVMSGIFRAVVDIELMSVDQITYSEFIMSLVSPSCSYTFTMAPMEGKCILDFNPALTFGFVERMFGGTGKAIETERELTGIERAVMVRIANRVMQELSKAWKRINVVNIESTGFETNPQFIQIVPPGETVIVITFQVKMLSSSGILTICYPFVTLEPIAAKLSGQSWIDATTKTISTIDRDINVDNLSRVTATVSSRLGDLEISIRDFLNVRIGDVIALDKQVRESITVLVEGCPKFLARPGLCGKKRGFEILETL